MNEPNVITRGKLFLVKRWRMIKIRWEAIPDIQRYKYLKSVEKVFLRYLYTAVLLAVVLRVFVMRNTSYFMIVLGCWCLVPLVEHYYLWFRSLWQDELREEEVKIIEREPEPEARNH